jgi:hypothetical protein
MRQDFGLTLDEAAPLLDKTRSALGRIEKAETMADVHLVRSAMDAYHSYDAEALELARHAMRPGWWQAYGVREREVIGLETAAVRSLELDLVRLPVLLQTDDYMHVVLRAAGPVWSSARIENECTARIIRQQRLTDERAPLELSVLMDESVLHKPVGGAGVMRGQFRQLLDMAELDTVDILVLPDAIGAHAGMTRAFTVLEFEDEDDSDVLAVRYVTDVVRIERSSKVARLKDVFNGLCSVALSPMDSIDFIKRLGAELYSL